MKKNNSTVLVLVSLCGLFLCSCTETQKTGSKNRLGIEKPGWQLTWHDEFDRMDHSKWDFNDPFGKERWS